MYSFLISLSLSYFFTICYNKKENMEKATKLKKVKRKRKHGFLSRSKSHDGRKVLRKRRLRGRKKLTI